MTQFEKGINKAFNELVIKEEESLFSKLKKKDEKGIKEIEKKANAGEVIRLI